MISFSADGEYAGCPGGLPQPQEDQVPQAGYGQTGQLVTVNCKVLYVCLFSTSLHCPLSLSLTAASPSPSPAQDSVQIKSPLWLEHS